MTELVSGIDIVREQVRVAAGAAALPRRARRRARVTRSRSASTRRTRRNDYRPAPGRLERFRPPLGPGVRVDTAVADGSVIPPYYDSMIAKVIVRDDDRARARSRAPMRALAEMEIVGIPTTRELALDVLRSRGVP